MILLTKASAKEAKKCGITDQALIEAVRRAFDGNVDAQLGDTLIKQEVARPPEGRKTACRAIIAIRRGERRCFVMHVYAKSAKSDLSLRERDALSDLSKQLLMLSTETVDKLVHTRGWKDIDRA